MIYCLPIRLVSNTFKLNLFKKRVVSILVVVSHPGRSPNPVNFCCRGMNSLRSAVRLQEVPVADLGRGRTDARCPVWSCSAVRWNPRLPSFAHARTWQVVFVTSHFQNQVCAPPSEKSWIRHWELKDRLVRREDEDLHLGL